MVFYTELLAMNAVLFSLLESVSRLLDSGTFQSLKLIWFMHVLTKFGLFKMAVPVSCFARAQCFMMWGFNFLGGRGLQVGCPQERANRQWLSST